MNLLRYLPIIVVAAVFLTARAATPEANKTPYYEDYISGASITPESGECVDPKGAPITKPIVIRRYDEQGFLVGETFCEMGKREGTAKGFYKSGKIRIETPYKNGKAEGIARSYYENRKLREEMPYQNGKMEGFSRSYYENGQMASEIFWKNNRREGVEKVYYESGKLFFETPFQDGRMEGVATIYRGDGATLATIAYQKDAPVRVTCVGARGVSFPLTPAETNKINFRHKEVMCP